MKVIHSSLAVSPKLYRLLVESKKREVSEEELQEQRISFAFGNLPVELSGVTKESVRETSKHISLKYFP